MKLIININTCRDCKHLDHTGEFTKGGAKPCCNHPVTCKEKGYNCFKRVIPYKNIYDNVFNREIHEIKGIPVWCPLKNGNNY